MTLILVASLFAAVQSPQERVQLAPTTAAAAIEAFGTACMATFPNPIRFRRAIAQRAGYSAAADGQWRSRDAVVSYVANGEGVAPQCSLDALLDKPTEAASLVPAVQARLRQHFGLTLIPRRAGAMIVWSWSEDDRDQRVILDLGDSGTSRQLSLSLQRLK